MLKKLLMALVLATPSAFSYDITYLYGIERDLYIIDSNADRETSLASLLKGEDNALVLMHKPDLIDAIKGNPYGRETFVFIKGFDALNKYDTNKDSLIDINDIAYVNLGLFTYNNKTGNATVISLADLDITIRLQDFGAGHPVILDRKNRVYPISHLLAKPY
jgi:hypothetical protein